jgi:hypothetical protein
MNYINSMNLKFVWTYGNVQALRMAENGKRGGLFIYRKLSFCIVIFKLLGRGWLMCTWRSRKVWNVSFK